MPSYLVLKGSKNFSGAFRVGEHLIYPIFCVFMAILGHLFSKNRENFLKMAPQAKLSQNFTQKCHTWCVKGFKISLK